MDPIAGVLALALANSRYWPTVAPVVRQQLRRWQAAATQIEDPRRRALALGKLREERFNPQLAATLATTAPRSSRVASIEAIVAGQISYDYRDALQERSLEAEDAYARELAQAARAARARLPGWSAVAEIASASAARCAEAQRRGHAAIAAGDGALRRWAQLQAASTGLHWPEWLAGAQASVLGAHALVALAGRGNATHAQAIALDRLYLSIGALSMLDTLIDRERGPGSGELGYERWYESPVQMGQRLAATVRDARERAGGVRDGARHLLTLTGVVAFYASAPQAARAQAQAVLAPVQAELRGELGPVLALMRAWRLAKRVRCKTPAVTAALAAGAALALAAAPALAQPTRSLSARDEAHLSYVSASGSTLYETGRATGTLPGSMRVHMRIAATFSGSFTIYAAGGSIAGHGNATPHGVGVYESFSGSLTLSGGSGRYRHAHGTARLYGTFDRNNYALLVQTQGTLRY